MESVKIREKFIEFFRERGHTVVRSSSLIPEDPSVLLTTAGMQQFKPYFTGELDPIKDFGSRATTSIQKCFRTSDIDEVGDERHLTFFEMLGNFSFGGYFKEEAINYAYEFITGKNWMNLKIDYVSIFEGDKEVPPDEDSGKIWLALGIKDIRKFGRKDNFWGPTGKEGPCGPTTEIYVKNASGQSVEIWNIVFNEYYSRPDGSLEKLDMPGVDTGMGLERLAMVAQKKKSIFETDLFTPLIERMPADLPERTKRILADHARSVVFLISDGVRPSNKEAGYILRRLMRRMISYGTDLEESLFTAVAEKYEPFYPELDISAVTDVFIKEKEKFSQTLGVGLKELNKLETVDAKTAFKLYETFGLPYETIKEVGGEKAENLRREDFEEEFKKHQELSRTASAGMFKGGLADTSEKTVRLHTAHHLLLKALQIVLGPEVKQRGSNITSERLRMDFVYDKKMTEEQKKEVERIVNEKIAENLPVIRMEMKREEAEKLGAEREFGQKYPEWVSVYSIGPEGGLPFSIEFCGGPHVSRTGEIGRFRIIKEEAVSAGVRRIRGVIE